MNHKIGFVFLWPAGWPIAINSFQIMLYADLPRRQIGFVLQKEHKGTRAQEHKSIKFLIPFALYLFTYAFPLKLALFGFVFSNRVNHEEHEDSRRNRFIYYVLFVVFNSSFSILHSPFYSLSIIRTAMRKSGLIFKKSPLHGVHYSAIEGQSTQRRNQIINSKPVLSNDEWIVNLCPRRRV
jgi:hypothetical protein